MKEHYKEAMLKNIEQNIIERMAIYLDSEGIKLDEQIGGFAGVSDDEELHERMGKAAFAEYKKMIDKK